MPKLDEKKASRKAPKVASAAKAPRQPAEGFTAEEREAMKERARELKTAARGSASRADGEREVLARIAGMTEPDRTMASRLHAVVLAAAPELVPRLWYGMPAYAKSGKVLCYYQSGRKFKTRYSTFGFSDEARLDAGRLWPTAFALAELTAAEEVEIAALVKRAMG